LILGFASIENKLSALGSLAAKKLCQKKRITETKIEEVKLV